MIQQISKVTLDEAIRAMEAVGISSYTLSRGVGVYDSVQCREGTFWIRERIAKVYVQTDILPRAWLIGDNWTLTA